MALKTEVVSIKVTAEDKEKIKELAKAADITVSKFLYKIVMEGIKE